MANLAPDLAPDLASNLASNLASDLACDLPWSSTQAEAPSGVVAGASPASVASAATAAAASLGVVAGASASLATLATLRLPPEMHDEIRLPPEDDTDTESADLSGDEWSALSEAGAESGFDSAAEDSSSRISIVGDAISRRLDASAVSSARAPSRAPISPEWGAASGDSFCSEGSWQSAKQMCAQESTHFRHEAEASHVRQVKVVAQLGAPVVCPTAALNSARDRPARRGEVRHEARSDDEDADDIDDETELWKGALRAELSPSHRRHVRTPEVSPSPRRHLRTPSAEDEELPNMDEVDERCPRSMPSLPFAACAPTYLRSTLGTALGSQSHSQRDTRAAGGGARYDAAHVGAEGVNARYGAAARAEEPDLVDEEIEMVEIPSADEADEAVDESEFWLVEGLMEWRGGYKWLGSRATLMSWSIPLWEDESMLTAPPVQVNAPECT
ncbi:hypothetical protein Ctob_014703 [Chrysochromulina tobinii]|uniref:Uncharacterized protein n=1 Tax=Chrysochromulina tobinii TaxID=1460289 RepID=A0A0M0KAJ6_9EUKA|nr:hypothetical protein Ctob_014703 [Chrysochromulina tobinii]|eukprot:KOO35819.1 hypothetical protein Ctob_014703 [Chrysochromulina sp. CCMP291]